MSADADLYEQDFVAWTEAQAAQLRAAAAARVDLPLDWGNLAEEIESLGESDARELGSHLTVIVEHLLKLRWSPALDPLPGWKATVARQREEIEGLLEQSPSLRRRIPDLLARAHRSAHRVLGYDISERGELSATELAGMQSDTFDADQVLGDWFPERR